MVEFLATHGRNPWNSANTGSVLPRQPYQPYQPFSALKPNQGTRSPRSVHHTMRSIPQKRRCEMPRGTRSSAPPAPGIALLEGAQQGLALPPRPLLRSQRGECRMPTVPRQTPPPFEPWYPRAQRAPGRCGGPGTARSKVSDVQVGNIWQTRFNISRAWLSLSTSEPWTRHTLTRMPHLCTPLLKLVGVGLRSLFSLQGASLYLVRIATTTLFAAAAAPDNPRDTRRPTSRLATV